MRYTLKKWLAVAVLFPALANSHDIQPRIIDGANVTASSFPSVCRIVFSGDYGNRQGTGTLISPRHVLTVAHGFSDADGKIDIQRATVQIAGRNIESTSFFVHPAWTGKLDKQLDVSIIVLPEPVTDVAPMAIRRRTHEKGTRLTLVGFGMQGSGATGQNGEFWRWNGERGEFADTFVPAERRLHHQRGDQRRAGRAHPADALCSRPADGDGHFPEALVCFEFYATEERRV